MTKFNNKYKIEPNRWQYWDYSANGHYFITICVEEYESILGDIKNEKMILSTYGEIVKKEITKINDYNIRANVDEWIVMPNHIHLLIELMDMNNNSVDEDCVGDNVDCVGDHVDYVGDHVDYVGDHVEKIHEFSLQQQQQLPSPNQWFHNPNYIPTLDEIKQYRKQRRRMIIPKIVGKFKMQTSKQINIKRNTLGIKNWQTSYYDQIIRDEVSYKRIKEYIINNPRNWNEDRLNGTHTVIFL